ncbi:MAG TPA: potassium channel protein [Oligoflexia bacterium]|nr:potassium channel protein [Oligoflexia bacterium]HMR25568.1 potassium channel protein [Oligoflexia bacterium]
MQSVKAPPVPPVYPGKRLLFILVLYCCIIMAGVGGYMILESWPLVDAIYMTIITISTVGFSEVYPLSQEGKMFTAGLIILGVGGFTYTFTILTDYIVKGQIQSFLRERRKSMEIKSLRNHYVVCGFGRVGQMVCKELKKTGKKILVLEKEAEACEEAKNMGFLVEQGTANEENNLDKVGIRYAKGLIATLNTDEANLMLVLTARSMNEKLNIVARSNFEVNEKKLVTAGADRVISPYSIGGRRMAQLVTQPNVIEFLDTLMHNEEVSMWMEDLQVSKSSALLGMSIEEAKIREKTGVNIVGIRNQQGQYHVSPKPDVKLNEGDLVVALGTKEQLKAFQKLS